MTTTKEENPFHLKLFGKFVLFANPGIGSSIRVPRSIPASSLIKKIMWENNKQWAEERVCFVIDVTAVRTRRDGTGDTGSWPWHRLVLLPPY